MQVDLQVCFVLDYHRPMKCFMSSVLDQVKPVIEEVKNTYPMKVIEIAFVGYGGYFCVPYTKVYPFTSNVRLFQKRLDSLRIQLHTASSCRNVQQAYGLVNDLNWTAKKRLIFHMGNGPAFGPKYHDPNVQDLYPAGHPYLVLEEEVHKFARKRIDLILLKIDNNWNKMVKVIEENYLDYRNQGFHIVDLTNKYGVLCDEVYIEMKKHILRQFVQHVS